MCFGRARYHAKWLGTELKLYMISGNLLKANNRNCNETGPIHLIDNMQRTQ